MHALEGLHHITAITADAPRNVDFYARLLGLRFVKKTVNFDRPDVYHLYYADEHGTPGSVLTFFEFPDAARCRHGEGMPYSIAWRVASAEALGFWSERLAEEGVATTRGEDGSLEFADPEDLEHVLIVDDVPDAPLVADAPDIPAEHALQGFAGVRAHGSRPGASAALLEALGFAPTGAASWELAGDQR
ncbi:MAG: VOC family protein, partial [Actinomycetota bacterium]|nr:VOC family protein [Actinomycetota bacterium]